MPDQIISGLVSIAAAVIGLAALSVLLSRNARTVEVIDAASRGYGHILGVAISPVTGNPGSFDNGFSGGIGGNVSIF